MSCGNLVRTRGPKRRFTASNVEFHLVSPGVRNDVAIMSTAASDDLVLRLTLFQSDEHLAKALRSKRLHPIDSSATNVLKSVVARRFRVWLVHRSE